MTTMQTACGPACASSSSSGEPGDSGAVGGLVPVLFVRLYVCTTGDALSTELYLRTATGEVYVA